MTQPKNPHRTLQFSIRSGLLLVAICAAGIVIYQNFIYEPPTNRIPLYEKAIPYAGTSAKVGPNVVGIKSVVRNDRHGGVRCENGRGSTISVAYPHRQKLVDCGPWLDVAQFELEPGGDLLDIQEVRIFDHETRNFLADVNNRIGWRLVQPNVVQLYGLGEELPNQIDLWLRTHSYEANDRIVKLAPRKGAKVQFDNTTLTVAEIQLGYLGWSSAEGFIPVEGEHFDDFGIEIKCETTPSAAKKYQIGVVLKDGRKENSDRYYRFDQVVIEHYNHPLDEVDHFEIRPFGGCPPFFFEGIRLPGLPSRGAPFTDPPTVRLPVSGQMTESLIDEFAPLDVRIAICDGNRFSGSMAGGRGNVQLKRRTLGPEDLGKAFTLALRSFGLKDLQSMAIQYHLADTSEWSALGELQSNGSAATSGSNAVRSSAYRLTVDKVDEIKLNLLPAP